MIGQGIIVINGQTIVEIGQTIVGIGQTIFAIGQPIIAIEQTILIHVHVGQTIVMISQITAKLWSGSVKLDAYSKFALRLNYS